VIFADITLSKRLERAEAHACAQFAVSRRRLFPHSGAEWIECGGAYAVFDGIGSPVTQSFGLGIFEPLTTAALDTIERFFFDRGSEVNHEVSPLAGPAALAILAERGYSPIEISSVLYRPVENPAPAKAANIEVHAATSSQTQLWSEISARGWAHEHPEFFDFVLQAGAIISGRADTFCFIADLDRRPAAAGVLSLHEGVALFGGASTIPEMRRRGLQAALLEERMRFAFHRGCDLAMMVAEAGSNSQRNAERKGFRIAYTRTKWRLPHPSQITA